MNDGERGFFTMDMFFALLILVATSTVLLNFAQGAQPTLERTIQVQRKDLALEKLATGINTVYSNGPSFELYIDLPENIDGGNYSIKHIQDNRTISIDDPESTINAHIIPGNVDMEDDIVSSGKIRIFWDDDKIKVVKV